MLLSVVVNALFVQFAVLFNCSVLNYETDIWNWSGISSKDIDGQTHCPWDHHLFLYFFHISYTNVYCLKGRTVSYNISILFACTTHTSHINSICNILNTQYSATRQWNSSEITIIQRDDPENLSILSLLTYILNGLFKIIIISRDWPYTQNI